jgi:hypothetical protein
MIWLPDDGPPVWPMRRASRLDNVLTPGTGRLEIG